MLQNYPHENEIYMQHIQLFVMKIFFKGLRIIYVKYILASISQKIYAKYILIKQLFAKIYLKYFDIYVTCIFFHVSILPNLSLLTRRIPEWQFYIKNYPIHFIWNGKSFLFIL